MAVLALPVLTEPDDIASAILPTDENDEIPSGFTLVGHVGRTLYICPLSSCN